MLTPEKDPLAYVLVRAVVNAYMHIYHRMEVYVHPEAPKTGPFIALTSHFSILDTVALFALDPYNPKTTSVVKASMFEIPMLGRFMRARAMVPVSRHGRDIGPLRTLLQVLHSERGICLAAEGRRSRTGRLGPINKVVVRLVARSVREGIPVFPVAVNGTFEALPTGSRWPRPRKIQAFIGKSIDLEPWRGMGRSKEDVLSLAKVLQSSIANLLPPERRPAANTPVLETLEGDVHEL